MVEEAGVEAGLDGRKRAFQMVHTFQKRYDRDYLALLVQQDTDFPDTGDCSRVLGSIP